MINFKQLIARLGNNTGLYAGFPPNTIFDYSERYDLLRFSFNNLGDPFQLKNAFSTHEYEREVIKWFLRLYSNDDTGWGYVTNGGTEGIIQGIWNGREQLDNPIIYYSQHSHYSIPKAAKLLNLESRIIECDGRCELSYDDFARKLIKNRDSIFVSTIGNTVTSSVDDANKIVAIFYAIKKYSKQGFIKLINNCISNAEFFCKCFNENGMPAWGYHHSINIVLEKLPEIIKVLQKRQIGHSLRLLALFCKCVHQENLKVT